MLDRSDEFRLPFDAVISGGTLAGYSWTAVPYAGQPPTDSPRSGTLNLFELNNRPATLGTCQRIWFRNVTPGGGHEYEFSLQG